MSSNLQRRRRPALLSGDDVAVRPLYVQARTALLSVDVETDFGTGRRDALSHAARFLDLLGDLRLPLTAFVEGQLFEREPALCGLLVERGVDVQLHVYDHSTPGDTAESLARSVKAYEAFMDRRPEGYRAHTYRLTPALYEALVSLGFKWDSSLMRAYGLGRNDAAVFRRGDYFLLGGLVEFPLGVWRYARLPLNHPYTLLAGSPGGRALRTFCGPSGSLVAYNVHMTDLIRSPALKAAHYGRLFELMQHWMWLGHGADTLASYRAMCDYLRERGFTFMTTSQLYAQVASSF